MKAIAIRPGEKGAFLKDTGVPEIRNENDVMLEVIEVGICGTDREEVQGGRADAPAGETDLIIGHEMLGRVVETGAAVKKVKTGDPALFMVRRPCGHCIPCSNGRSDMCASGDYTERGIKGRHGFQAQFVTDSEDYIIPVPESILDIAVLTEPMSVVVKAIDEAFIIQESRLPLTGSLKAMHGRKALVAGLGPVGLLAAFVLSLYGAEISGLDIVDETSPRPSILKSIGGIYINGLQLKTDKIDDLYGKMDFIFEATGIASLEFNLLDALGRNGIFVLTGIPSGERPISIPGALLIRQMVLMNQLMLGSVNASIKHYHDAVDLLTKINDKWNKEIRRLITGRIPYTDFMNALTLHSPDEIKTVIKWK